MWPSTERITHQVSKQNRTTSLRRAGSPELLPVSGRLPLGLYILELWEARHFIRTQAFARASTRYDGTLLGNMWLVFSPMLDAAGYFVVFALILKVDRGIPNFPAFLAIGIFLFSYTSRSVSSSAGVIRSNKTLVRAFSFPRMALILANVLRDAVILIPTMVVLFGVVLVIPPPARPTKLWLLVPVVIVLQTIFNIGVSLTVARATNHVPDLAQIIRVLTRFWMFLSGVMFSINRFVDNPAAYRAMQLNPAFQVLDMSRDLILYETEPAIESWLILSTWAFAMLVIGFIYFWRGEVTYGKD